MIDMESKQKLKKKKQPVYHWNLWRKKQKQQNENSLIFKEIIKENCSKMNLPWILMSGRQWTRRNTTITMFIVLLGFQELNKWIIWAVKQKD